jgi:hypothetical protein
VPLQKPESHLAQKAARWRAAEVFIRTTSVQSAGSVGHGIHRLQRVLASHLQGSGLGLCDDHPIWSTCTSFSQYGKSSWNSQRYWLRTREGSSHMRFAGYIFEHLSLLGINRCELTGRPPVSCGKPQSVSHTGLLGRHHMHDCRATSKLLYHLPLFKSPWQGRS